MSKFIFYTKKKVLGKYKKIYRKEKLKKEYIKKNGKYISLIVYIKNNKKKKPVIKKKNKIKKGGSILYNNITDSNGNYIPDPMCQDMYNNPEKFGLTKSDLLDIGGTDDPIKISLTGGKVKRQRRSKYYKPKKKKYGGSLISDYMTKVSSSQKI